MDPNKRKTIQVISRGMFQVKASRTNKLQSCQKTRIVKLNKKIKLHNNY